VILFFLFLLLVFAAGAGLILMLHPDSGYVLINYGPWVVETSLTVLVLGVVLWFVLVWLVLRLLGLAVRLPGSLREAIDRRRENRARQSFETGLLTLFEGNWKRAELELVRRAADHHAAHLNYLAAARAAQHQGALDRRDHYLRQAAASEPEHESAVWLAAADLQRKLGEFAAVKATALRLRQAQPEHPFAIELLAESHAALAEWEALRSLLAEPAAVTALTRQRYDELQRASLRGLMRTAVEEARLDRLKALWDAAGAYRDDAGLRRDYAGGLARLNADADAMALIAQTLTQRWDPALAQIYGELHGNDPIAQLSTVEQWLGQYSDEPELLQVAGRVCVRNKLWGKARSYFEGALQKMPTPQVFLDLARLCQDTQAPDEAAQFYRKGLELAAEKP
jgi:HemY protein